MKSSFELSYEMELLELLSLLSFTVDGCQSMVLSDDHHENFPKMESNSGVWMPVFESHLVSSSTKAKFASC